jgi:peptidoglycan/LPS O-acetylase OafA/YrhL
MTKQDAQKPHILAIDGLRAVAVVAVIFFHLVPKLLPGGYAGVDVFFAISGYVVTKSLMGHATDSLKNFFLTFYSRRLARIYPALLVCLVVTGLFANLIVPANFFSGTSSLTGLSAFFGMSNFALVALSGGYFSPRIESNPYGQTWSLGVEEQFYLLFPIVLYLWLRRKNASLLNVQTAGIFLLTIVSLVFCAWQTHADIQKAYFLLPSRFWELGCGAILCILHRHGIAKPTRPWTAGLAGYSGFFLVAASLYLSQKDRFPYPWALMSVVGSLLLIAAATFPSGVGVTKLLASRPMTYVGRLSYSLYLWHYPIFVFVRWMTGLAGIASIVAALSLTLLFAIASYHWVEPLGKALFSRKFHLKSWRIPIGAVVALLAVVVFKGIYKLQPFISLSVTSNRSLWNPDEIKDGTTLRGPARMRWSGRTLYVVGDSHAIAYSGMLRMLSAQTGVDVKMHNRAGCSVENLLYSTEASGKDCVNYVDQTFAKILAEAKPDDLLFVPSLRARRFGDEEGTLDIYDQVQAELSQSSRRGAERSFSEADRMLSQFGKKNIRVLFDAPLPIFPVPAYRCADAYDRDNPLCANAPIVTKTFLLKYRAPVMDSLARLVKRHKNFDVWDPFNTLCPGSICSQFQNRKPLFFDTDHLSGYGDRILYTDFKARLYHIWPTGATKL